jgi:hypothetical protein
MSNRRRHRPAKSPPFVMLPHYMLDNAAWKSLSLAARAALVELHRLYNGTNNGRLAMPARDLAARLGCSKTHAARVLIELEETGFIRPEKIGTFKQHGRIATEYALTLELNNVTGEPPTKAFMKWRAPRSHRPDTTVPFSGGHGPAGGTQATKLRVASHIGDRETQNGMFHRPTGGTHIESIPYQPHDEGGSRSAPIGSAVASEPPSSLSLANESRDVAANRATWEARDPAVVAAEIRELCAKSVKRVEPPSSS